MNFTQSLEFTSPVRNPRLSVPRYSRGGSEKFEKFEDIPAHCKRPNNLQLHLLDSARGFEGFLKTTRRQQMKTPVNARMAGTSPNVAQTASMNQPKRPKCNSDSQNSAWSVNRSAGSSTSRVLNSPGNTK